MGGSKTPKTGTSPYEGALSQMALDAYNQTAGIRNYFLGSPAGGGAGTISMPARQMVINKQVLRLLPVVA